MHAHHAAKVIGNIGWYSDRFDQYNEAIRQKLAISQHLPIPGQIPQNLDDIFAFVDGTANEISRPGGPPAVQNPFWNGYYHGHFLIWQGKNFCLPLSPFLFSFLPFLSPFLRFSTLLSSLHSSSSSLLSSLSSRLFSFHLCRSLFS